MSRGFTIQVLRGDATYAPTANDGELFFSTDTHSFFVSYGSASYAIGNDVKGADIASATTTDLSAATGSYVHITGTTTITGLGTVGAGTKRYLTFTGALTLTNGSGLVLPGGANITTAAGDTAIFVSEGSGNWRCISYTAAADAPGGGAVNLTGPIASVGAATSVASQTGTGSTFVMNTSPTLITPLLGTPTSGNLANCTFPTLNENTTGSSGSCTGNSATVTTNANLTGPIASVGNATSIASQTGTGSKFVVDTSPTLVTPNIGTPSAGVLTHCTGYAVQATASVPGVVTVDNVTIIATAGVLSAVLTTGPTGATGATGATGSTGATGAAGHGSTITSGGVTFSSFTSAFTVPVVDGTAFLNAEWVFVSDGINSLYGQIQSGGTTNSIVITSVGAITGGTPLSIATGSPFTWMGAPGAIGPAGSTGATGATGPDANLTGPITSVGAATSVASQTGTGSVFVMNTSPTLVTPVLGTPTSGTLTNCTGLPVVGGGTGASTFTTYGVLLGDGTSAIAATAAGATGAPLIGQGSSAAPIFSTTSVEIDSSFGVLTSDADASTITFNLATSNTHTCILGGNRTFALSNPTPGQKFLIRVGQPSTGGPFSPTWFTTIRWAGGTAPTLTTTNSKYDTFGFLCTGSGTYDGYVIGKDV
jgi:hypothetical protein